MNKTLGTIPVVGLCNLVNKKYYLRSVYASNKHFFLGPLNTIQDHTSKYVIVLCYGTIRNNLSMEKLKMT